MYVTNKTFCSIRIKIPSLNIDQKSLTLWKRVEQKTSFVIDPINISVEHFQDVKYYISLLFLRMTLNQRATKITQSAQNIECQNVI